MKNYTNILGTSANNAPVYAHPDSHLHFEGELLAEVISKLTLEGTFTFQTVDMGRIIGVDHLVETTDDSEVFYMERPYCYDPIKLRAGKSRMTFDQPAPTQYVSIGLCFCNEEGDPNGLNGKWVIFTVFEGKTGEKEVFDRAFADGKNPEGLKKAQAFWANHALSATEQEKEYIRQRMLDDSEFLAYLHTTCPHATYDLVFGKPDTDGLTLTIIHD